MNDQDQNPFRPPTTRADSRNDQSPEKPLDFDHGKLVTLAEFSNSIEAHAFKDLLTLNGIASRVTNEEAAASLGIMAGTTSSFSPAVMIREEDSEAGLALKQEFLAADLANTTTVEEWTCRCGETVDAGFEVCWSCQAGYEDRPEAAP